MSAKTLGVNTTCGPDSTPNGRAPAAAQALSFPYSPFSFITRDALKSTGS